MTSRAVLQSSWICVARCTYKFHQKALSLISKYDINHQPIVSGLLISSNEEQRRYKRPEYLKKAPPTRTVKFDYSGDLVKQSPIDGDKVHYAYSNISEINQSPVEIQQLFTLKFADGAAVKDHRLAEMEAHIESCLGGDCQLEKEIAKATIGIRNEMYHCMTLKKDTRAKARLVERIQSRKKKLKELRKLDFERFVWLLQELRIKYVSPPEYYRYKSRRYLRKEVIVTEMFAEKKRKMDELRAAFEKEFVDFEVYKRKVLSEVEADMKALGLTDEDVIKSVRESEVPCEPDLSSMSRLQRALYEEKKAKKEKEWKYVREV